MRPEPIIDRLSEQELLTELEALHRDLAPVNAERMRLYDRRRECFRRLREHFATGNDVIAAAAHVTEVAVIQAVGRGDKKGQVGSPTG